MTTTTYISPAMRSAVGTELARRTSYPVSASDIRRWAIATYWPDPAPSTYLDEAESPVVAPEEFNPFAWAVPAGTAEPVDPARSSDPGPDRSEIAAGITGPGLERELNGGMSVEYGVPMRVGDVITSITRLGPYNEREGRLGLMLFSALEDTWTNQHGEVVKRTTNSLIRY